MCCHTQGYVSVELNANRTGPVTLEFYMFSIDIDMIPELSQ